MDQTGAEHALLNLPQGRTVVINGESISKPYSHTQVGRFLYVFESDKGRAYYVDDALVKLGFVRIRNHGPNASWMPGDDIASSVPLKT